MAVATSQTPGSTSTTSNHFSISSLISRFRSKRQRDSIQRIKESLPPLKPSPLPLVLPEHQDTLSRLGWATVTLPTSTSTNITTTIPNENLNANAGLNSIHPQPQSPAPGTHPLLSASSALFAASATFFALPATEKAQWKTKLGSEEGWSCIPGEKEFITLRTIEGTPEVLREAASRYWECAGMYLEGCLGRVEGALGMLSGEDGEMKEGGKEGSEVMGGLKRFVGPCKRLGEKEEDKTATMLRLFRYEGWEEKVVAERHADLGLLSFVIGSTPGLEVWNGTHFIPIEKSYNSPCATLLSGRQLQRLTNYRYPAGGHRVVSYGKPTNHVPASASPAAEHVGGVGGGEVDAVESNYRFSIVFVLRAHEPIIVDTDALTTEITGVWKEKDRIRGITAGEMYAEIRATHFNINTGLKERDEQRRKVAERKRMEMGVSGAG